MNGGSATFGRISNWRLNAVTTMQITIHGITFEVDPEAPHHPGFWDHVNAGRWEPETYQVFKRYLSKNCSYLDIGAWIGPTVLYGRQLAKRCYAYEPDPVAFQALQRNLALNPGITNVQLNQQAARNRDRPGGHRPSEGAGDSMTSFLWTEKTIAIQTTSFEDILSNNQINDLNFIKMDIEGAEWAILVEMRAALQRLKPTLLLSLHAPFFRDKLQYLSVISDGLSMYDHLYSVDGTELTRDQLKQSRVCESIIASGK